MKVKMINIDGETLFLKTIGKKNRKDKDAYIKRQVSKLNEGIYFLQYNDDDQCITEKIVIS